FQDRTELFPREFQAGNMSLHLKGVRSSDQGFYTCRVSFHGVSHEEEVELKVAG
ncbi:hypothetical protein N310_09440, partial [Acanthisitta chloris]